MHHVFGYHENRPFLDGMNGYLDGCRLDVMNVNDLMLMCFGRPYWLKPLSGVMCRYVSLQTNSENLLISTGFSQGLVLSKPLKAIEAVSIRMQ